MGRPECDNRECAGVIPGPARSALCALVEAHRPWTNDLAFATRLGGWALTYWQRDLDCIDISDSMRAFGRSQDPPDHESAVGLVFHMLRNVAAGRHAGEYDLLGEIVRGRPARTMRRYRRDHGATPAGPLHAFLARFQQEQCLVALTRDGRTLPAARRWLERHPDWLPGQPGPRPYRKRSRVQAGNSQSPAS